MGNRKLQFNTITTPYITYKLLYNDDVLGIDFYNHVELDFDN